MRSLPRLAVIYCCAASTGCIAMTTYQTPVVLDQGQLSFGGAVSGMSSFGEDADFGFGLLDFYGRVGIAPRTDIGLRFSGIPPLGVLQADVKYQVVEGPIAVAADLGASYMTYRWRSGSNEGEFALFALYPLLLVGTERLYVGGKGIYAVAGRIGDSDSSDRTFLPGAVVGATVGDRWQFHPEVSVLFGDRAVVVGGFGVRYTTRPRSD